MKTCICCGRELGPEDDVIETVGPVTGRTYYLCADRLRCAIHLERYETEDPF
ncbi:MAG TPA: hypothetical protein VEJ84_05800 [Acidimicrobiales bacterium]|nr:hypothetical protein [Acidimicrobiales bacterium]